MMAKLDGPVAGGVAGATAGADRIELLDALRGFALFGILMANWPVFTGWVMLSWDQEFAMAGRELTLNFDRFVKFFIDGKFYTIFSLLFGIGFTLQLDRLEKRGAAGMRIFRRRMLVLLAIGFVHMSLIWQGDILTLYAALGLLLPLFSHWPERRVLWLSLVLLLLPLGLVPLCAAAGIDLAHPFEEAGMAIVSAIAGKPDGGPVTFMQSTEWSSFAAWQLSGTPFRVAHLLETWRLPKVLGIMLLGMVIGRRLIAGTLLADRKLLGRTVLLGLLIGVPFSLYFALDKDVYQEHWSSIIGTVPLALAYAAAFALAWPRWHRVLGVLAPVGRMALTNYLTHSLLGVLLLGPFLGIAGTVGPIGIVATVLAIYACQIAFSHWWLARHEQGPMERLWRWGTYGTLSHR